MTGKGPERNRKGINAVAQHRHKRETNARRLNPFRARAITIAAPLALVATGSAVGLGVLNASPQTEDLFAATVTNATPAPLGDEEEFRGGEALSRSAPARIEREPTPVEKMMAGRKVNAAIKAADTQKWTTAPLNLWDQPGDEAEKLGEIGEGEKVLVTGRSLYDRVEIVVDGESRWVTAGYLVDGGAVHPRRRLHQRQHRRGGRQPQHREGPRGRLRGVPRHHDLRHVPR